MKSLLKSGHTFLIQGPAVARTLSGIASTLGKPLSIDESLTVRAGRLKIIEAQDDTELDVVTGEGGKLDEVETSTIPPEWTDFVKKTADKKAVRLHVMVLGGADTGKNTFITYACNKLLMEGLKVAVIDADMGQAEVGPPTTMSVALLGSPVSELLEVHPDQIFFVGAISPSHCVERVLSGAEELMIFLNRHAPEAVVFTNMPGWVSGPGAMAFIVEMVSRLGVDSVAALQRENEVEDVLNGIPSKLEIRKLPASTYARMRSREERKFLRDTSYRKYFTDLKETGIRYSKLDFSPLFSSRGTEAPKEVVSEVESAIKGKVLHCEETNFSVNAIVAPPGDRNSKVAIEDDYQQHPSQSPLRQGTMQRTTREIRIVSLSALNGLIVALFEKDDSPVSLGILRKIDFPGKKATVTTIIRLNEVARVEVGRVKLSPEGYEIGTAEIRRVILPSNSERASALERD